MKKFSNNEDAFLMANYLKIPTKRMAKMLGRSEGTARQRLKILGIVVPPEIVEKFRQQSYFPKGNISWNKGREMPLEVYERCKDTMFRKGQISHNKQPLGTMRITKDGYMEIKISEPNKWDAYHRVMWEETFGKIPAGHIVRFVTKDKMNVHPFNLELIPRSEHCRRNYNRKKAAESLRKTWAAVKAMEDYGILPVTIKFRSKRKRA